KIPICLSNSFRHFLSSIEKTMNWLQELAKLSVRFFPNSLSSPSMGVSVVEVYRMRLGSTALRESKRFPELMIMKRGV
ncbi:hypothetical protein PZT57_34230, partial [Pseudomonas aeruginosa]|uniref:hypothetical protein n=1 Tax=Pseudomonas aeruginosa TaxID=287 RepID=UPI002B27A8A2